MASAHAAAVALDGYKFAAPDKVHLSSSPGRRSGLGSGRTRFAASDETGLEETQRDDIEDVDLHSLLFISLGMIAGRARTTPSFGRLQHVVHRVPQVLWGAPLVAAVIAPGTWRAETEAAPGTGLRPQVGLCLVPVAV